ncbi:MAG: UvrD-helicase domain-containing protein [Propionibacteriaceae bacterium]|nr:UvrD-helicase domain-containing protein [Propionibacteriaceae bacterium]
MTPSPTPFDLVGELPSDTLVIEASAGTGKTYTLSALALRFIAEGHAHIDEMVMITFSRLAAGELRSRVYGRLRSAGDSLRAFLETGTPPRDAVDALLCSPGRSVAAELERIETAILDIDDAIIDTIHGFCTRMLRDFSEFLPQPAPSEFSDDLSQLTGQAIRDTYLIQHPEVSFDEFSKLAGLALSDSSVPIISSDAQDSGLVTALENARTRFQARKLDEDVMGFSDVIVQLRDALLDPSTGTQLAAALAGRYQKVLVDEFQDTDADQWMILRTAFAGNTTLVLIGDPKQSIYKFRGADVFAYLDAVGEASAVATLATNHRSDPGVVAGVDALFADANLGTPEAAITVLPVQPAIRDGRLRIGDSRDATSTGASASRSHSGSASPSNCDSDSPWVSGEAGTAPAIRIRVINSKGNLPVDKARRLIDDDLCEQVISLLDNAEVRFEGRWRRLRPNDVAVLVSANRRGEEIVKALGSAGVAAVFSGAESVFASVSSGTWLALLDAVSDPASPAAGRVAVSPLVGYSLDELAGQAALVGLRSELTNLQDTYLRIGPTGVFESVGMNHQLTSRVLSRPDGERVITDLRHLGELLQTQWQRTHCSAARLADWLNEMCERTRVSGSGDERTRRVETDQVGVQVMTVHAAKGLEFPVVMLPQAADSFSSKPQRGVVIHRGRGRVLDVGKPQPGGAAGENQRENDAETLRKLYVGFTRARSLAYAWWAPTSQNLATSGLALLRGIDSSSGAPRPDTTRLSSAVVSVELASPVGFAHREPPSPLTNLLSARALNRDVDSEWTRTSYSGLTDGLHEFGPRSVADESDVAGDGAVEDRGYAADDSAVMLGSAASIEVVGNGRVESDNVVMDSPRASVVMEDDNALGGGNTVAPGRETPAPAPIGPTPAQRHVSPLSEMPAGTQFGLIVHEALEHLDTNPDTLETDMTQLCERFVAHTPLPGLEAGPLASGLLAVMHTPLGELAGGRSLAEIPSSDRLAELSFELPLGSHIRSGGTSTTRAGSTDDVGQPDRLGGLGGRSQTSCAQVADLATLFSDRSMVPETDPLAAYGPALGSSEAASRSLSGWLTGSIDALLRLPDGRFVIVDYKTNRFPTPLGSPLYAEQYSPTAMANAMIEAHYPLQALLYCVATSRFLSQRIADFSMKTQFAGVGYLFVRGMIGPHTPVINNTPCGVFTWHPTPELVAAASKVLAGGDAA